MAAYRALLLVLLVSAVYLLAGVALPNPATPGRAQFLWRLGSWGFCAFTFAVHIAVEHFRFGSRPWRTALHAALAVALGAVVLAAAANIHARSAGTGNQRLLALALVIWPLAAGLPAFVVALCVAAVLGRVSPNDAVRRANPKLQPME